MKNIFSVIYLCVAYIPFLLPYGALDSVYTELFYLSSVQFITSILLAFNKNNALKLKVFNHLLTSLLLLFLMWSFITVLTSFNKTEGIIDWYKNYVFYVSILNLTIIYNIVNKKLFFYVIIFLLGAESILIFYRFLNIYNFENPPNREYSFVGFTSNLNVAAYSILIKLPLAFYLLLKLKNKLFLIFIGIIIFIGVFDILIISSRSSILALLFIIASYAILFVLFRRNNSVKPYKSLFILLILCLSTFLVHKILYINSDSIAVDQRLTSFDLNDPRSSSSFRLGFYHEAIKGFLEKPIFGYGMGNWKIFSIQYGSERIREYQVPYHVHNDFLQMFVETGFLGGLLYLFIYILPIFYLIRKILDRGNKNLILDFSILMAFTAFFFDSSFNFPRTRAISMMNMVFFYSYFISSSQFKLKEKFYFKNIFQIFKILNLLLILSATIIFYRLYINSTQQIVLLQDFNFTRYFERDLDEIKNISHVLPTLTHTGLPLSSAKANYYFYQGKKEKAKELYRLGNQKNPYLGDSDLGLAKLYLNEGIYDSAYFYSKRALKKLPYNQVHIAIFQKTLLNRENENFKEADSIFNKTKELNVQALWENHLLLLIKSKHADSFNLQDKSLVKIALSKFPNSKNILTAEKLINNKKEIIVLANEYDLVAQDLFQKQKYQEAIDNWELAKNLIPNEDAYYLNIAQSFNGLKMFDFALAELDKVERNNLVESNGKLEFLKAVSYLGLQKNTLACRFFKMSADKGYELSAQTYRNLNCGF